MWANGAVGTLWNECVVSWTCMQRCWRQQHSVSTAFTPPLQHHQPSESLFPAVLNPLLHRTSHHTPHNTLTHLPTQQQQQVFEVPDGYRMVVTSGGAAGRLSVELHRLVGDKPTWEWSYTMEPSGAVGLEFVRNTALDLWSSPLLARRQSSMSSEEEDVFDFVI